jgi:hypothetical protein
MPVLREPRVALVGGQFLEEPRGGRQGALEGQFGNASHGSCPFKGCPAPRVPQRATVIWGGKDDRVPPAARRLGPGLREGRRRSD